MKSLTELISAACKLEEDIRHARINAELYRDSTRLEALKAHRDKIEQEIIAWFRQALSAQES